MSYILSYKSFGKRIDEAVDDLDSALVMAFGFYDKENGVPIGLYTKGMKLVMSDQDLISAWLDRDVHEAGLTIGKGHTGEYSAAIYPDGANDHGRVQEGSG